MISREDVVHSNCIPVRIAPEGALVGDYTMVDGFTPHEAIPRRSWPVYTRGLDGVARDIEKLPVKKKETGEAMG